MQSKMADPLLFTTIHSALNRDEDFLSDITGLRVQGE